MFETVQKEILEQLLEFIIKRDEIIRQRYHDYKESHRYHKASEALHESMTNDVIRWYLTDEKYRSKMNEIYEIKD